MKKENEKEFEEIDHNIDLGELELGEHIVLAPKKIKAGMSEEQLKEAIDHAEWYIKKTKESMSGPYAGVLSSESKKFKRENIKKQQEKIKEWKKALKELKGKK